MHVTMEHRQNTGRITGVADHYLDCRVQFDEEEKATIRLKGLYDLNFDIPPATPPVTMTKAIATDGLFRFSKLGTVGFLIASFFLSFTPGAWSALAFLAAIGCFFVYIYLKFFRVKTLVRRMDDEPQTITVRHLYENKPMTVWKNSPAELLLAEDEIKQHLSGLKTYLAASGDTRQRETFEI